MRRIPFVIKTTYRQLTEVVKNRFFFCLITNAIASDSLKVRILTLSLILFTNT